MVEVDILTVTAYKCVHCKALFEELDRAMNHLDECTARPRSKYMETEFGNMIMKEAV